jgi:hypothetical protein
MMPDTPRPPRSNHPYNDPTLSPIEFMRAVMHCPDVPLIDRVKAAEYLLPYEQHRRAPTPVLIGDKNVYIHIKVAPFPDGTAPGDDTDDPAVVGGRA